MAKKNTSTKTIIVISASVLIAGGLGFLIWKLVNNNKKKKEEEKRKKEEEETLKYTPDMINPFSVESRKKSMVKGAIKGIYDYANQLRNEDASYQPAPSIKISAPNSTNPIISKNITLENKVMGSTPSFKPKPTSKEFNVYKPLMK